MSQRASQWPAHYLPRGATTHYVYSTLHSTLQTETTQHTHTLHTLHTSYTHRILYTTVLLLTLLDVLIVIL